MEDGRTNPDTLTVVFDYGPANDPTSGFQVQFTSRFSNSAGETKELYYSNGGMINLDTNEISSTGGLREREAAAMGLKANLVASTKLEGIKVATDANTGGDPLTFNHIKNWMECAAASSPMRRSKRAISTLSPPSWPTPPTVPVSAMVSHEKTQEVLAGGKPFKY